MKPVDPSTSIPSKHLIGQTVLVTRAAGQSLALVQRIEAAGGRAVVHPVIEILPAADLEALEASIERLVQFGLLVFTSRNGVQFFKDRSRYSQSQLAAANPNRGDWLLDRRAGSRAVANPACGAQAFSQSVAGRFPDR